MKKRVPSRGSNHEKGWRLGIRGAARVAGLAALLLLPTRVWAGHPLITDDTGTQGKGKSQLEVNGQADRDTETIDGAEVKTTSGQGAVAFSYGALENTDLVVGIPYQWYKIQVEGVKVAEENGISDLTVEIKRRFYDENGVSLALKPGITLPTGDDEQGLGTGRFGYHLFAIASLDLAPWAFHANLGYIRNENKVDEEADIWHLSAAVTYEVIKNLRLVGNIGREKNLDPDGVNDPSYLLGGVIYGVTDSFDLDCGLKYCLNSAETDLSLLAGVTMRW